MLLVAAAGCTQGGDRTLSAECQAAGQRMYETGRLASGEVMAAGGPGGASVPGTTFACVGCHNKSGLLGMDESRSVLPVNGASLFRPRFPNFPGLSERERSELLPERYALPAVRPAYTDETLARALRTGVDPSGRTFGPTMPRYDLAPADLRCLVGYLRSLSVTPSPGVPDKAVSFATVITDEVPAADREQMAATLEWAAARHNNLGHTVGGSMSGMLNMGIMRLAYRDWSIARWTLTGAPETWGAQLEAHYARAPVFALVGGISTQPWAPVHAFCESKRLPCILPITELPPQTSLGFYSLYFHRGVTQEGEAVARFLDELPEKERPTRVVEVVGAGPEAAAIAEGFRAEWRKRGHGQPESASAGDAAAWRSRSSSTTAFVLWTGADAFETLRALAAARPRWAFMSATLVGGRLWELPTEARGFTYFSYPFRDPAANRVLPKMGGRPIIITRDYRKNDRRIQARTTTAVQLLESRLGEMDRNFFRDHLIDLFHSMDESLATDYPRLSFESGRSFGADGCYVMQLSQGSPPDLVRKSELLSD
jgi:hypothetical protein